MANSAARVLGVDFGTLNTAAAVYTTPGGATEVALSDTAPTMPSTVFVETGGMLVGQAALDAGLANPALSLPFLKLRLATPDRPSILGRVAAVLRSALDRATGHIQDDAPDLLVTTYPDIYTNRESPDTDDEREITCRGIRDGMHAALDAIPNLPSKLCPESTAAMACFIDLHRDELPEAAVVVNLATVQHTATLYLPSESDVFNAVEVKHGPIEMGGLAVEHAVAYALDPAAAGDKDQPEFGDYFEGKFAVRVRDVIDALADQTSASIILDSASGDDATTLSRERLDEIIEPYLSAAVELARSVLVSADERKTAPGPTVLILAGKAGRNPTLVRRMTEIGLAAIAELGDPRTIIARGAAAYGAMTYRERPVYDLDRSPSTPVSARLDRVGSAHPPTPPGDPLRSDAARSESSPPTGGIGSAIRATRSWVRLKRAERQRQKTELDLRMRGPRARPPAKRPATAPPESAPKTREQRPPPPPTSATDTPQPDSGPQHRQLVANIYDSANGKWCRTSLMPKHPYRMEIRIAIPSNGEQGVGSDIDGRIKPQPEGFAELDIVVSLKDGARVGGGKMLLSTMDRQQDSTPVPVEFQTYDESPLVLRIDVLFQRRPIQSAVLVAEVLAIPTEHSAIQLWEVPLSAPREPRYDMTPADAALTVGDANLTRLDRDVDRAVDVGRLRQIASKVEEIASSVLGNASAPDSLSDPRALGMLIKLARLGIGLRQQLEPLDIAGAQTIAMTVAAGTSIVPLEIAYDGTSPSDQATLCDCLTRASGATHRGGAHASSKTLCLNAFWGMSRVIARVVEDVPVQRVTVRPAVAALALHPILYGAAKQADELSQPGAAPSVLLKEALGELPGKCTAVKSWRSWRSAVRADKPELLVVLGHAIADSTSEIQLFIGTSSLGQSAMTRDYVTPDGSAPPLVLLFACSSGADAAFGPLSGTFVANGAAAVVASLTKFRGSHAAAAARVVLDQVHSADRAAGHDAAGYTLATALIDVRRKLLSQGLAIGLLLVSHGEIDLELAQGAL